MHYKLTMPVELFLPVECPNIMGGSSTLLIGDTKTYKTTLLFQASITVATEGEKVIFIRPEWIESLPSHVHGLPNTRPSSAQHIKFKYMNCADKLKYYLCQIHIGEVLPGLIVVDDLDFYANEHIVKNQGASYEQTIAALSALLKDAAEFCTKKRGMPCYTLVSITPHESMETIGSLLYHRTWRMVQKPDDESDIITMISHTVKNTEVTFYYSRKELFLNNVKECFV